MKLGSAFVNLTIFIKIYSFAFKGKFLVLKHFADVQGERRGDRKADQVAERHRNGFVRNRNAERKVPLFGEKFICEA